ncbi:hypothetical protein [Paenibacillus sp. GCM10023250]|uniref:hypothetical protein n=1 Tax=Paenibacillus sp. GCM10023250 TaxID=3252648 RepID=UPI00361A4FB1
MALKGTKANIEESNDEVKAEHARNPDRSEPGRFLFASKHANNAGSPPDLSVSFGKPAFSEDRA